MSKPDMMQLSMWCVHVHMVGAYITLCKRGALGQHEMRVLALILQI